MKWLDIGVSVMLFSSLLIAGDGESQKESSAERRLIVRGARPLSKYGHEWRVCNVELKEMTFPAALFSASLENVVLYKVDLREQNFLGFLRNVDCVECQLDNADLTGARIILLGIDEKTTMEGTQFPSSRGITITGHVEWGADQVKKYLKSKKAKVCDAQWSAEVFDDSSTSRTLWCPPCIVLLSTEYEVMTVDEPLEEIDDRKMETDALLGQPKMLEYLVVNTTLQDEVEAVLPQSSHSGDVVAAVTTPLVPAQEKRASSPKPTCEHHVIPIDDEEDGQQREHNFWREFWRDFGEFLDSLCCIPSTPPRSKDD